MATKFLLEKKQHHEREPFCTTRAPYRDGNKLRAVKVFTVANESLYLIIKNVPDIQIFDELNNLCGRHGLVDKLYEADGLENEEFTKSYVVKYVRIKDAIFAKKRLDEMEFFGGILHVCYAPELESVAETKKKLEGRQKYIKSKRRYLSPLEHEQSTARVSSSRKRPYVHTPIVNVPQRTSNTDPLTYDAHGGYEVGTKRAKMEDNDA